jgi:GTP pyrophosphokinase
MEAIVPGSTADMPELPAQGRAISIKGLTPGVGFDLAQCCHPLPGDRIVGLRRKGAGVEVHAIDCIELANGVDADWVDLSWGEHSHGAVGRLNVVLYNRPGTLAEMAGVFARNSANVMNLELTQRDDPFHTYEVDLEVQDLAHLTRILSSLRANDAVAQTDRI